MIARRMPPMDWTAPSFEEIKMDAEIGSYQEDSDPLPFVRSEASAEEERTAE
jgi:hypothetical protein